MLNDILNGLLPVFFGLGLGYFAGKSGMVENRNTPALNSMLINFVLPITLFVSLAKTSESTLYDHARVAVVVILTLVPFYVLALLLQLKLFRQKLGDAALQAQITASANFSAVGFTLLMLLFGENGALLVAVAITIAQLTTAQMMRAVLLMSRAEENAKAAGQVQAGFPVQALVSALWASLRQPIFLGPALGLCLSLLGIPLPHIVEIAVQPMIATTGGLGLFLTGLLLSAQPMMFNTNVFLSTVIKLVVIPLWAYGIALLLGFPERVAVYSLFIMALPSGYISLVYAAGFGVKPRIASSTMVMTSIGSALTLSVAIAWLHGQ